jgi:5'-nucleotidase
MTGVQIASVLREQCQPAGSSRPFLDLGVSSGFTYTLSRTIADGTCTSVAVRDLMLDGKPLDPAGTYQVTVNDYLADGGDNFATFADVAPALRRPGDIDREALIEYLAAFAPVAPPDTNRVTIAP